MRKTKFCSAFGCLNTDKNRKLSFFSLPKDAERRRKWLTLVDRYDLLQKEDIKTKSYLICSEHFEDSSIKEIRHLKDDALPTLHLYNRPQEDSSFSETQDEDVKDNILITLELVTEPQEGPSCSEEQAQTTEQVKGKRKTFVVGTQTESSQSTDAQTQTTKALSDLAFLPTKRKFSEELKESKSKCRKLERDYIKIKTELEEKCSIEHKDEISRRFQKLIEWQNNIKSKHKGNRYDTEYKVFAVSLYNSSPQAYKCLKTMLKLPTISTLHRFRFNIPLIFDEQVLDCLVLKIKSLPDAAKYCSICIDEIALKRNLHYDVRTDEIIGLQNINGEMSPDVSSNAFMIMLRGINFEWKQPISYAMLATTDCYEGIDSWINDVIEKLSKIGVKVKAIVSHQGSNFDKFAKEVKKVTLEQPYFIYDNTKVYYVYDIPELIKCIRNNLLTNNFLHNGKIISWDYIEQLYEDQKERNLRLIPKITDAHIQPNNSQRKRTELAVQIFSRTVSSALHTYIDFGQMSEEARPTAVFIELMNNLFDVLNSSKISIHQLQTAYGLNEDQKRVLNDATEMFAAIEAINRKTGENDTEQLKFFQNFSMSIQSVQMLFEGLKQDGFTYLLTQRLNQDNLEKIYGSITKQGGSSSVPTALHFQRAYSSLFICNIMKSSTDENCEVDICDLLLKAEDMTKMKLFSTDPSLQKSTVILKETDYQIELPDDDTLIYLSAYLFFKGFNGHSCPAISEVLKSVPDCENDLFSKYEAYNKTSEFHGRLKMPPKDFIYYVKHLEIAFTENFDNFMLNNPGGKLLELFKTIPPLTPCSCYPVDYLLKLFITFRIFTTIQLINRKFKCQLQDDK